MIDKKSIYDSCDTPQAHRYCDNTFYFTTTIQNVGSMAKNEGFVIAAVVALYLARVAANVRQKSSCCRSIFTMLGLVTAQ